MCSQISFIRYCAMLATRISKLAHFFQQNVTAAGRVYGHERVGGCGDQSRPSKTERFLHGYFGYELV